MLPKQEGGRLRILICYASTEGQTRRICRFCADRLFEAGHSVELLEARNAGGIGPQIFDAVLLAGSVHVGRLQPELATFVSEHAAELNRIPSLFLQVSLAAAGGEEADMAELERIAREFCASAGFRPDVVRQVAGAFRFSEYDFFKSLAMRYIAHRKGQSVDPHKDTEYTDWDALARVMEAWPTG